MHVAILHHHFHRGGVTQVVLNQLRALDAAAGAEERIKVALIHGGRSEGLAADALTGFQRLALSTHTVPTLDYDQGTDPDEQRLAGDIAAALESAGLQRDATMLHVHNHGLGKNVSLPGAVRRLAGQGFRCLLQIHDFAEDSRPANYRRLARALTGGGDPAPLLYPQASHIHYAVLNGRDLGLLRQAGVADDRLHKLPNLVGDLSLGADRTSARTKLADRFGVGQRERYLVYPVRGIRRKNLGEVLLLAALRPHNTVFAVTLPPLNPQELPLYQHWKRLAGELDLRCALETGAPGGLHFHENLAASDALLTTSVAEGFGMVFLESWSAGRNLLGRDLPEITADFVAAGLRLESLYRKLSIPLSWLDRQELHDSLATALAELLDAYGMPPVSPAQLEEQIAALWAGDAIDFAALSSALQSAVIRRVCHQPHADKELLELNPALEKTLYEDVAGELLAHNSRAVRETYSLDVSGKRLVRLYETVLSSAIDTDCGELPHARRILTGLLNVSRLHPIRFE